MRRWILRKPAMLYLGQVGCRTAQDNALEGLRSIYSRRNEDIYLEPSRDGADGATYEIDLRESHEVQAETEAAQAMSH